MADKHHLAQVLVEIAIFLDIRGENPFKVRAYENAARAIEKSDLSLEQLAAHWDTVKGFGKTIGQQVEEYAATGSVAYYDELKVTVPPVLFDLVKIPGLGPKKALLLHDKLGINSVGELEYACRENRLVDLPGFGAKTQEKLLEGIDYLKKYQGQFLLCDALPVAEKIAQYLNAHDSILQAVVAGSIRRRVETVRDIDIVVASSDASAVIDIIKTMPGVEQTECHSDGHVTATLVTGINLDVFISAPEAFGTALHRHTGSPDYFDTLSRQGYTTFLSSKTEAEVYGKMGLPYIAPEMREGRDEVEAAVGGTLPELVTEQDIRGVFHAHSTWSDGTASISAMADRAASLGWQYLGITDHSRTAVYARGLQIERIAEQRREIEGLNAANPAFRILAGIESDILPDGSLDYPDEILAQFDFVIASIHSAFRMSEKEMTRRILKAMENKYVTMLGHPTGRILLARKGYELDIAAVIDGAAQTGTYIEINCNPYRLDLDWRFYRQAKAQGVMLSANPDAHSLVEMENLSYGVAMARKGWLTVADIINTRGLNELEKLLKRKRTY